MVEVTGSQAQGVRTRWVQKALGMGSAERRLRDRVEILDRGNRAARLDYVVSSGAYVKVLNASAAWAMKGRTSTSRGFQATQCFRE